MTAQADLFSARSWLFAPGDSDKKMEKATSGPADIVIFDVEDAVAPEEKPKARTMIREFLQGQASGHARLWVRINPLPLPEVPPASPCGNEAGRNCSERSKLYRAKNWFLSEMRWLIFTSNWSSCRWRTGL